MLKVNHNFNPKYAKKYGIEEAIIIENMYLWITDKQICHDDVIWYNAKLWIKLTGKELCNLFKYIPETTIRRKLYHLIDEQVIETGNFNLLETDRSLWYSLTDKFLSIIQNE